MAEALEVQHLIPWTQFYHLRDKTRRLRKKQHNKGRRRKKHTPPPYPWSTSCCIMQKPSWQCYERSTLPTLSNQISVIHTLSWFLLKNSIRPLFGFSQARKIPITGPEVQGAGFCFCLFCPVPPSLVSDLIISGWWIFSLSVLSLLLTMFYGAFLSIFINKQSNFRRTLTRTHELPCFMDCSASVSLVSSLFSDH